jgi:glycosyltransferase involved in cell wall biosynthesis
MSRVLVVSQDYVRRAMAGPAIRSFELAHQLHLCGNEVTLATPVSTDIGRQPFPVVTYDDVEPNGLRHVAPGQDVVIGMGWVFAHSPVLRESGASLVADLYDPFHLENLAAMTLDQTPGKFADWEFVLGVLIEQIRVGDFFLCASERQRDLWIGAMSIANRINPATYEQDPSLRRLIDVVPFGLPDAPPARTASPAMRGVVPGIGHDDFVLFWGGGIYNWFDPLTLIEAVSRVAKRRPEVRLFFLSTGHPNPHIPEMDMVRRARELAAALDMTDRHVFFNEAWVPYERRADWLLESDVGVTTHVDHAETRYSFRTRVLDYFWAGLPIICTAGDSLADLVDREDLGFAVPEQDPAALADAIGQLAGDPEGRLRRAERVREVARGMSWSRAIEPLARFCARPARAADLAGLAPGRLTPVPFRNPADGSPSFLNARSNSSDSDRRPSLTRRAASIFAAEGPSGLAQAARRRLRRARPGK